jgi:Fe-S oxidoreductase
MATNQETKQKTFNDVFFQSLIDLPDGERFHACIQCGTCGGVCPFGLWMDYSPRKMISALRAGAFEEVLDTDTLWMCVSCYACTESCPQEIPLTVGLMTRAKEELLLKGNIPAELQTALENSQRYGNPMGESQRKRAAWADGIDPPVPILGKEKRKVEVLWYVGDYASYHPGTQVSTKALARVLNALGVDYGILGPNEVSDGDSQRMAGENGLFEMLAEKNGKVFSKFEFDLIITTDPHAYNAFKNTYPDLGVSYPVQHYTQFLAERLDQLEPLMKGEVPARVAYHDACYLGRANGIYDEPRDLLKAIPGVELIEMSHSRSASLCCGGGGGGMWLDGFQWEKSESRLSEWRVREAVGAQPILDFLTTLKTLERKKRKKKGESDEAPKTTLLAVACPYEKPRFEDATKTVPQAGDLVIKDIAELIADSMGV